MANLFFRVNLYLRIKQLNMRQSLETKSLKLVKIEGGTTFGQKMSKKCCIANMKIMDLSGQQLLRTLPISKPDIIN